MVLPALALNLGQERRQLRLQGGEEFLQIGATAAGFVVFQQRVVAGFATAKAIGFLTLQGKDLFQPGTQQGEGGVLAGSVPFLLRHRGGPRQLFDQSAGQPGLTIVQPAQLADVGCRVGSGIADQVGIRQDGQQLADARMGSLVMLQAGEMSQHFGAISDAAFRQVGLLIPAEQRDGRGEQSLLAAAADELVVSGLGMHR